MSINFYININYVNVDNQILPNLIPKLLKFYHQMQKLKDDYRMTNSHH